MTLDSQKEKAIVELDHSIREQPELEAESNDLENEVQVLNEEMIMHLINNNHIIL